MFLFPIPFILAGIWMIQAQKRYLKLYRKKKNPKFPILQEEIQEYFFKNPIKWYFIAPYAVFHIFKDLWRKNPDSQLESFAKEVRKRYIIMGIVVVVSLIFIYIFNKFN